MNDWYKEQARYYERQKTINAVVDALIYCVAVVCIGFLFGFGAYLGWMTLAG